MLTDVAWLDFVVVFLMALAAGCGLHAGLLIGARHFGPITVSAMVVHHRPPPGEG